MSLKTEPLVSIIISVYDQLDHTKRCIHQIEQTLLGKVSYEVIIIDDCSKSETIDFLKNLEEPHKVFFNHDKKGFAVNNNLGAHEANGKYLCFLNNDVFVQGNWLLPMINVFQENDNVGMVGNVQKLAFSQKYDHMGVVFAPQGNPRHYGQGFYYRPFKGEVRKWSAVTAACCVTRKELFLEIGGFDEIYKNGCEDIDLCLRMTEQKKEHYIVHDSVVLHVKGASEGRKLFNDKNSQILQKRWGQKIISLQSILDQHNHAWTYLCRGIMKPWSVNLWKWTEALLIFFRLKKLGPMN